jgi:hypothetical protein
MVRIPVPREDHGRGDFLSENILMKMESATDTRMTVEHKVLQRKRALKDNEDAERLEQLRATRGLAAITAPHRFLFSHFVCLTWTL